MSIGWTVFPNGKQKNIPKFCTTFEHIDILYTASDKYNHIVTMHSVPKCERKNFENL
jgi:hypothetical protein